MVKWANYLISEVSYGKNHLITFAKRHEEIDQTISKGHIVDRLIIASDIKKNLAYVTIHSGLSSWKRGRAVNAFMIKGEPFLRIDKNKVRLDNLGDLPEVNFDNLTPSEQEKIKQQSKKSDIADSKQQTNKEKSKNESHRETQQKLQSPRGSLPKDTSEELSQELELLPEEEPEAKPDTEQEATSEQITRLDNLKKQIDDLEAILASRPEPDEDEVSPDQLARLEYLEKQIEKLEINNLEEKLENQNKKLDEIESKINISKKTLSKQKSKNELEAYCVKCRQKRIIDKPKETTMKNGRPAVRGTCSKCGTKVFRIIKKR